MVNPRFTDKGTLHALCLTSPLLNAPEKVQKRSGSRLQKFRNGLGGLAQKRSGSCRNCLGAVETVQKRSGSHPKRFRNGPKRPKRAPNLSVYDFGPPDFLLVFCKLNLSRFQLGPAKSGPDPLKSWS